MLYFINEKYTFGGSVTVCRQVFTHSQLYVTWPRDPNIWPFNLKTVSHDHKSMRKVWLFCDCSFLATSPYETNRQTDGRTDGRDGWHTMRNAVCCERAAYQRALCKRRQIKFLTGYLSDVWSSGQAVWSLVVRSVEPSDVHVISSQPASVRRLICYDPIASRMRFCAIAQVQF